MMVMGLIKRNKLLVAVFFLYLGMFLISSEKAAESVRNSAYYLIEMFQVLPVIFLLTVVIEALVPKKMIIDSFGEESGWKGRIYSLVLGSISAGPVYAAFPVCKTLLGKGASINNIVIVLSSWAVIKIPMLANEVKFLGARFMLARWVLTVLSILIMGQITSILVSKKHMTKDKGLMGNNVFEIKKDYCVGCGICAKLMPDYYGIKENKAYLKQEKVKRHAFEKLRRSAESCPTQAIEISLASEGID